MVERIATNSVTF